jgi:hypothetical protein
MGIPSNRGDGALFAAEAQDFCHRMRGDGHGRGVCQYVGHGSAPRARVLLSGSGHARVCPFCGDPPGLGMFCTACGRNLAAVERLPTRGEWEAERRVGSDSDDNAGSLTDRCTAAATAFLAAMHAAGDPGCTSTPVSKRPAFGRTPKVQGWIVRPVDRDDDLQPRRYEPGLVLSLEGTFHRLDSEVRGWGQRNFPQYDHTVSADPIDMPVEERLVDALSTLLRANGVAAAPLR